MSSNKYYWNCLLLGTNTHLRTNIHWILIAVNSAHTRWPYCFLFHMQPWLQKSVANRLMFWVTVFARLHYPSKSYCLLTLTPLNTVMLTNSLLCTLQQLNTLYADLHMGISAYWIILDEFNKMLLGKKKKKVERVRTFEDELVFQKTFVNY